MIPEERIKAIEDEIEHLKRRVSLTLPPDLVTVLAKTGYNYNLQLPSTDPNLVPMLEVAVLQDRVRLSFRASGMYRYADFDFYYEVQ